MHYVPVVSIRMDQADYDYLKSNGENLSEFVRRAVHEKIETHRLLGAVDYLESLAVPSHRPAEDMIREDRDAR